MHTSVEYYRKYAKENGYIPDSWYFDILQDYLKSPENYVGLSYNQCHSVNNQIVKVGDEVLFSTSYGIEHGYVHHFTDNSVIIFDNLNKDGIKLGYISRYYTFKRLWKL
jgi:hypothetical protein